MERTNKKFPPFFALKTGNLTGYDITESVINEIFGMVKYMA